MTITLNGPVITTLKARLETNMPIMIADINLNQITPVYTIDNPAQVLDYIPTTADLFQFPTLGISDGNILLDDDTGWGATGIFDLTVVAFIQDADLRALAWKLRRYAQAMVRSIRSPDMKLGDGWGIYNFSVRPGPTLGRDEDPRLFMSTVAVTFFVKTEQDT